MAIEIKYVKNEPKKKVFAHYLVLAEGKQMEQLFPLDSDNLGRKARADALKWAQTFCKVHFQIIPEHRGADRYTLTTVAPAKPSPDTK